MSKFMLWTPIRTFNRPIFVIVDEVEVSSEES